MPQHEPDVVVLQCFLCKDPADGLIVTIRSVAWYSAMDHALDEHRARLIACRRQVQNVFTMTTDGPPVRLRPNSSTCTRS